MSAVARAAALVAIPITSAVAGAGIAAIRRPGPKVTSGVQHFAAGVVFAAVAGEILPSLREQHSLTALVVGFALGVATVAGIDALGRRLEAGDTQGPPVGLVVAIAIDLLVDGLLVGIGVTLGEGQALVITIALTLEVLFLGLSLAIELDQRGIPRARSVTTVAVVSLAMAVGAIGGASALAGASHTVLAAVLAFGAAALLYLVTEELLVEAHERPDGALLSVTFFAGFLAIFILEGIT